MISLSLTHHQIVIYQVLEHIDDPASFLREQMRIARSGYIETPSIIGEFLFPKEAHKWLVMELDNKLVLMEKKSVWPQPFIDFGYLFLTWLQKTSIAYKLLTYTRPNVLTVRYEWKDSIEFDINPSSSKYRDYFSGTWDMHKVAEFFPEVSKGRDIREISLAFFRLCLNKIIPGL